MAQYKTTTSKEQTDGGKMDTRTKQRGMNKRNSGKPKNKGSQKPNPRDDGYPSAPGSNNPAWHSPDAKLLEQSASLSWAYQTGESVLTGKVNNVEAHAALPGIMAIREKLSLGSLKFGDNSGGRLLDYSMPATFAADTLLTEMRSRARLRNTYDAPDIAILLGAMANLYGSVFLAKRLVGTAKLFAYSNEYLPRALFAAQGMDYEWFRSNLFDFVSELNVVISEINKIYIPNRMHLFELLNERWSNYYTEGESVKDQIYMMTPGILSAVDYNPTTDWASSLVPVMVLPGTWTNASNLETAKYSSNLHTGTELLNVIKLMLRRIINHDSTPDITGDMMNCFGDSDRFTLPECDPSLACVPIFNEEILETIHNIKYSSVVRHNYRSYDGTTPSKLFRTMQLPLTNEVGDYNVFEYTDPSLTPRVEYERGIRMVDVHRDPNPYKVMEISRMRNDTLQYSTTGATRWVCMGMGAELVLDIVVLVFDTTTRSLVEVSIRPEIDAADANWHIYVCAAAPFHYAPYMMPVDISTGLAVSNRWPIGESDIYAELPLAYQDNMNRISLMTLLGSYAAN